MDTSTTARRLTTQEVCEQTGIPRTKIKFWVQALALPVPKDGKGSWRWTPELLEQLDLIKQLREIDGRTLESVRRVIGEPTGTSTTNHGDLPASPEADQGQHAESIGRDHGEPLDTADLADALVPRLVEALTAQNDLGERYAKATYQIGKLESDNLHLHAQLERTNQELLEARQRVALLESPKPARPWYRLW